MNARQDAVGESSSVRNLVGFREYNSFCEGLHITRRIRRGADEMILGEQRRDAVDELEQGRILFLRFSNVTQFSNGIALDRVVLRYGTAEAVCNYSCESFQLHYKETNRAACLVSWRSMQPAPVVLPV